MKTDELNLTAEELDELCRLYMDCELSVLEEKELEYVLSHTSLTSPSINEVRNLMNIQAVAVPCKAPRKTNPRIWKYVSGVAASFAVMLSAACLFLSSKTSNMSDCEAAGYIAAYSHGVLLSDKEAVAATNFAMAKADSLMNLASLTEREYMFKANNIINKTINN